MQSNHRSPLLYMVKLRGELEGLRTQSYLEVEGDEGEAPTEAARRPRSPRQARPYGCLQTPLGVASRSIVAAPSRGGCAEAGVDGGEEAEGVIGHDSGRGWRRGGQRGVRRPLFFSDGKANQNQANPLSFSLFSFLFYIILVGILEEDTGGKEKHACIISSFSH